MNTTRWRVALVGIDHMHASSQFATVHHLDATEFVGVWASDPGHLRSFADDVGISEPDRYTDLEQLLRDRRPDIAVICSTTKDHESLATTMAAAGIHVLLEKPLAVDLASATRILHEADRAQVQVGVNWPLAWYPSHRTTYRLVSDGVIGRVTEVHYYDGNRGPLSDALDAAGSDPAAARAIKDGSWWYDPEQGGSLRDYLGYGATLATWFREGELPLDVTARVHRASGDRVDDQAVVIARYADALSTFQTRWGTFTSPWAHQPAPRCGFVVVGSAGTITSWDYADHVTVQTLETPEGAEVPVDTVPAHETGGLANFVWCLTEEIPLYGPLSADVSLAGQRIVDAAITSVETGTTIELETVT